MQRGSSEGGSCARKKCMKEVEQKGSKEEMRKEEEGGSNEGKKFCREEGVQRRSNARRK